VAKDIQIVLTFLEQVKCGEYAEIINIPEALIRVETLEYPVDEETLDSPVDEDPSLNLKWTI
jgi:hypothetical protein